MKNIGHVHLWRYAGNRRSFPGYHFTADGRGCETVGRLLTAAAATSDIFEASLSLLPVTEMILAIPNNRGSVASSFSEWRVVCDHALPEKHLALTAIGSNCEMQLSPAVADQLRAGVEAVARRSGDFSVGTGEPNCLWFWWYPSAAGSSSHTGGWGQ